MEPVFILLTTLPASVLLVLVVGGLLFLVLTVFLLAFVPQLAERVVLVVDAFQRLRIHEDTNCTHDTRSSGQSGDVDASKKRDE
jgi:hypothetical protein